MTDALMSEAELLAALDARDGWLPSLDDKKSLALLRSQIAAHRREERERCLAAVEARGTRNSGLRVAASAIRALPDLPTTEHGDG